MVLEWTFYLDSAPRNGALDWVYARIYKHLAPDGVKAAIICTTQ
jgi:hypothetical protein